MIKTQKPLYHDVPVLNNYIYIQLFLCQDQNFRILGGNLRETNLKYILNDECLLILKWIF